MGENTSTKKRGNKLVEIIKHIVGGIGDASVGSKILWGGSTMLAATVTVISIMMKKKRNPILGKKQGPVKKSCIVMKRDIEKICINGFRLALHNPSRPLHRHAWSSFSLSEMGISGIDGEDLVSTKYLISEGKIVLQVQWKNDTSALSKEEIVIFDDLQTHDHHPCVFSTEQSLADTPFLPAKDPIRSDKGKHNALEQLVGSTSGGEMGEVDEPIEESHMGDINEEVGDESSSLVTRDMGSNNAVVLQQVIYKMTRHILIILVIVLLMMFLMSPKQSSILSDSLFSGF